LVNLALYHAIKQHSPNTELPPLEQLAAYQKLLPPQNFISENGKLEVVVSHHDEIQAIAQTLR
ncbi:MAG: hydrolase, partial [Pseudomonas sp.]|nr:hydrolase [Pseudomonas sp.]